MCGRHLNMHAISLMIQPAYQINLIYTEGQIPVVDLNLWQSGLATWTLKSTFWILLFLFMRGL